MSREKILNTKATNQTAIKLKEVMLAYHDYQIEKQQYTNYQKLIQLTLWQNARLKNTHQDLYSNSNYKKGLQFLFDELYSAKDFSGRDSDLERILPKIIKLLPKAVIDTVRLLVELNLLTQKLDQQLTDTIFNTLN